MNWGTERLIFQYWFNFLNVPGKKKLKEWSKPIYRGARSSCGPGHWCGSPWCWLWLRRKNVTQLWPPGPLEQRQRETLKRSPKSQLPLHTALSRSRRGEGERDENYKVTEWTGHQKWRGCFSGGWESSVGNESKSQQRQVSQRWENQFST